MSQISIRIFVVVSVVALLAYAHGSLIKSNLLQVTNNNRENSNFDNPGVERKRTVLSKTLIVRESPRFFNTQIISGELPCECGHAVPRPLDDRITGDWKEKAKIADMSWTVALVFKGNPKRPFCGGSLINDRFVLTAAHCVNWAKPEELEIRLNEEDFDLSNETKGGELFLGISEIILHPKNRAYLNDIALLRLSDPVDLTKTVPVIVRPICISTNSETDYSGVNGTMAGWGRISYSGEVSRALLKIDVPILSNQYCNEESKYKGAIRESMLCAGILDNGGPDSCPGDSGGPLTVFVGRRAVLVGIVSWGFGCGEPYSPGVYTRVSYFTDWILENTKDSSWCQTRRDNV